MSGMEHSYDQPSLAETGLGRHGREAVFRISC